LYTCTLHLHVHTGELRVHTLHFTTRQLHLLLYLSIKLPRPPHLPEHHTYLNITLTCTSQLLDCRGWRMEWM